MEHMQEDGYVETFFVSYEHVAHFDRSMLALFAIKVDMP